MHGIQSTSPATRLWHYLALFITLIIFFTQVGASATTATPEQPKGSSFTQVRVDPAQSHPLHIMDNLDTPFTIEINGNPIAKTTEDAEKPVPAKVGSDAAVFTLKDGRLVCGDYVLGRNVTENRSMLPKPVFWFKAGVEKDRVRPVTAEEEGSGHKIIFGGAPLKEADGAVFADILKGKPLHQRVECLRLTHCRGRIDCRCEDAVKEHVCMKSACLATFSRATHMNVNQVR
jgi:hypothetical protein